MYEREMRKAVKPFGFLIDLEIDLQRSMNGSDFIWSRCYLPLQISESESESRMPVFPDLQLKQ